MAEYFGVLDRGLPTTQTMFDPATQRFVTVPANTNQGGQELKVNASGFLLPGLRGVADIDYLSSYIFRAAFSENFTQAINSEVRSTMFLTKNWHGYSFNGMSSRYQNFSTNTVVSTTAPETVETIVHAPSFEASSMDRKLGRSPLYWGFNAAGEGLSRREPSFVTADVVGRYDIYPRITMPLRWREWNLLPEVALRDTWYGSRLASGLPVGQSVNRRSLQGSVELRPPTLSRIYDSKATSHRIKHVIEPRIVYQYTTGVDNFSKIIRFDARDILSDTHEVGYAVVNRFYSKRTGRECEKTANSVPTTSDPADNCSSREIASWELAQKYFVDPSFGSALVTGRRNVFTTTEELTGIAFLIQPRSFSPIVSRLRMRGPGVDAEWHLDYDTKVQRINSSMALVDYKLPGNFRVGGGHAFLQAPGDTSSTVNQAAANAQASQLKFNQVRFSMAYGNLSKPGIAAGATVGFDVERRFLQYSAVQTTYNWDCCGLTFEYRRFALGNVRNENQFRFALSLSNVGTFGTLRRQERLF
jgi:LPS-assembly protein